MPRVDVLHLDTSRHHQLNRPFHLRHTPRPNQPHPQPRLLQHLAQRRLVRQLVVLDVPARRQPAIQLAVVVQHYLRVTHHEHGDCEVAQHFAWGKLRMFGQRDGRVALLAPYTHRDVQQLTNLDTATVRAANLWARESRSIKNTVAWRAEYLPAVEIALALVVAATGKPKTAARVFGSVAVVYGLVVLVGQLLPRERPFTNDREVKELVARSPGRSFPSRHVASAVAMTTIAAATRPGIGRLMGATAAALAFSRVAAGVHYPSDVLAGALLGAAVGGAIRER